MGTSSSHSGNKDNKGLLPSDYDGQQSKPEVSWQATKTGFSKYINLVHMLNVIFGEEF